MDDDDIISVSPKFLVVSEAAPEREFIRRIVSDAPVAIEVMEVAAAGDVTATCEALACDTYDVVFLDSRMPRKSRQTAVDAIHAANGQPLAILVGPAKMKTREVLDDGLDRKSTRLNSSH